MSTALLRMGIEVSPTTCGRIMDANRRLYGLEKPQHSPREKLEMPFKAVRRHQFWSAISGILKNTYCLIQNQSMSSLFSRISVAPFLLRLFLQHKTNGIFSRSWPKLSDAMVRLKLWSLMGAGNFTAPRRFNSMTCWVFARNALSPESRGKIMQKPCLVSRNVSDFAFAKASTWSEIQQAHRTWWTNYNTEQHYAHRARQDGRHSPSEVLRGVLGRTFPEEVLSRALYATQFTEP